MRRILVPGRNGQVGWELQTALAPLGTIFGLDRNAMDLASPESIRRAIREEKPDVIVNAAAYNHVDQAEAESDIAMQVNGIAPGVMAEEAKRLGAILVHYSTDYVFDGECDRPYLEGDPPHPVNAYGESKLAGERAIEAAGGKYLVLRTSGVYSGRGSNFVLTILRLAREKAELPVVDDQRGSPTWARALARATAELLRREETIAGNSGVYHLAASGHASRYELAQAVVATTMEASGIRDGWARVKPIRSDQYPSPARRPLRPILNQDKVKRVFGVEMPPWEDQLRSFLEDTAAPWRTGSSSRTPP
jgi:dTDP-4-dehydrorhamnose reductase